MNGSTIEANNLREIAKGIEKLGQDLNGSCLTPGEQVSLGQALYLVTKKAEAILSSMKESLREEAVRQSQGQAGAQTLAAPDGSRCTVMIHPPSVRVRKDADMTGLKTSLGLGFSALFEEITTFKPRKDFQTVAATIQDPVQMQNVMEVVDIAADTPKVFFKDD